MKPMQSVRRLARLEGASGRLKGYLSIPAQQPRVETNVG